MPIRSPLDQLPEKIKTELDQRLRDSGFSRLQELTDWLNKRMQEEDPSWSTSRTALGRYSRRFAEVCQEARRTREMMTTLLDQVGPDELDVAGQALGLLAKEQAFGLLMALREQGVDPENVNLPKFLDSVSRLMGAGTSQKRWLAEERTKQAAKLKQLEEESKQGKKELDPETLAFIREAIYGL